MPKINKKLRGQTIESTVVKYLGIQEKRIDIPIVDNEEFRKDLIDRIEAVAQKMNKSISAGRALNISHDSDRDVTTEFTSREGNIYPGCSSQSQESMNSFSDSAFSSDFLVIEQDIEKRNTQEEDAEESTFQNSRRTIINFAVKRSRNKFVLMKMIMAEAHRLLLMNKTRTRRSFYYGLKNETSGYLVPHQRYVDEALNSVARLLKCAPWDLNLLPTAKGLVAGNMTITLIDNQVIDCTIPGGAQIPQIISNIISIRVKAEFVLVVEKDTIFQELLQQNCPRALKCIVVTGKGYPDVATRMLIKMLSEKMNLPVYIIVDANPFGVDIMLIYRFGSLALYKENESLVCPNARWLGIHPSELMHLRAKTVPLTEVDHMKLRSIEARSYVNEIVSRQLSILRKGKAEIEAVSFANFLTATYLPYKIDSQDYI